ncbi:hypothetical protein EVAR_70139_1 [Eumeta japonica]|uniref:Uncharacterized protein n=1 Tax=Eumeta variegata TaxID=151549 RepID=A0A4C1Z3B0_EUMVA|nr:hypothetical protein EVAR_70139_1 [Eumeta japonica]
MHPVSLTGTSQLAYQRSTYLLALVWRRSLELVACRQVLFILIGPLCELDLYTNLLEKSRNCEASRAKLLLLAAADASPRSGRCTLSVIWEFPWPTFH